MLNKPDFITDLDFKLLCEKYSGAELEEVIEKIRNNYPVQYAIGDVEFLNNKILVDERVLVPRFETELLVDKLCKYIELYGLGNTKMLDLCTGSGCIAIALKTVFPLAVVTGLDVSSDALELARENARLNGKKVDFLQKNVLELLDLEEKYSVLVSNPPYVKQDEVVSPNTGFEPQIALYPGEDDLLFYRRIIEASSNLLTERNIIAFEIGSTQGADVCKLAREKYHEAKIVLEKDYNQLDRFVFIFNNCE